MNLPLETSLHQYLANSYLINQELQIDQKSYFYQENLNSKHTFISPTLKVEEKKVPIE